MATRQRLQEACTLVASIALILIACPGRAGAAGVNLSWNDCGTSGSSNKTFACGTNTGSATLVGSFVAPGGIHALLGVQATLDMWSSPDSVGTPISAWWQLGTGGCRAGSIFASYDFTSGPSTCLDPWSGQAVGGMNYAAGVPLANHAKIRLIASVPTGDSLALTADAEYYAFKVVINYQKTVGTGSCSGCASPVSIALTSLTLGQPAPVADVILTAAASSSVATWQGGVGLSPNGAKPQAVTYGQIRSLYH